MILGESLSPSGPESYKQLPEESEDILSKRILGGDTPSLLYIGHQLRIYPRSRQTVYKLISSSLQQGPIFSIECWAVFKEIVFKTIRLVGIGVQHKTSEMLGHESSASFLLL